MEATQRGSERSTFTYDGSLPISETRTGAAPASLAWTYNTDFAPVSFTYAGETQTYGYDADGLVTSAAPFEIARRADNALPEAVTAPGFALSRSYNEYGEIDTADYGAYAYTLTRDISGRITQKAEETSGTARTWDYGYDTLGRLATVHLDGDLAESYAYDANGNRTAHRAPLAGIDTTQAASFDAEDRATSVGDATYTYTPDGYLALKHSTEGTTTYAYSAFGELGSVTLADGREVSYTYDAAGRRTSKAMDGTITAQQAALDEAGAVLKRLTHDSFGNVIEDSNPALQVPLGFAGGLADADTGLTLFGARDYDPALGRWIAKDPIGFAGGDANLYGYCLGDPVNLVDPSGLWTKSLSILLPSASAGAFALGASVTPVQFAWDDDGNIGFSSSGGPSHPFPWTASMSRQYSETNADTICNLEGWSAVAGGSYSKVVPVGGVPIPVSVGVEGAWGLQPRYEGVNLTGGVGANSPIAWELHGGFEYTHVWSTLNVPAALNQMERLLTGAAREAVHRAYDSSR